MLKKHSKIKFFLITIIAILGVLLCVCPFSIPYSSNTFNGFVPAINKGIDLEGGVEAVYQASLKEGETSLDAAVEDATTKLQNLYSQLNFDEVYVTRLGDDKIKITMSSEARVADELYNYIQTEQELSMSFSDSADAEKHLKGRDVKSVKTEYSYDNEGSYGIVVNFTANGKAAIETMKKLAAEKEEYSTVYIYKGSEKLTSIDIDDLEDGMFLSSTNITSSTAAVQAAHNIIAGSLKVTLKNVGINTVTPTLGVGSDLYITIALVLMIVASIVLICLRYGHLGLLGSLAMVFYLVFFSFLMQAIPFINLNLIGVVGCIVAYIISIISVCYVFEKIREEYALGKKIHLACKGGFKKALWPILDSHAAGILASICIWIFAPAGVQIFGIAILVGLVLSLVGSLGLLRWFVHLYLPINSTKAKKLHLYRDKNVKEIKEEVEIIPEDQVNSQMMEGENE